MSRHRGGYDLVSDEWGNHFPCSASGCTEPAVECEGTESNLCGYHTDEVFVEEAADLARQSIKYRKVM